MIAAIGTFIVVNFICELIGINALLRVFGMFLVHVFFNSKNKE